MKRLDIRARMVLAALLPLALIGTMFAVWMLMSRFDDLQTAYEQRNRLVARQVGLASEFGLFSGNQTQLQALAVGALQDSDVRWVAIIDARGHLLASAGNQQLAPRTDFQPVASAGTLPNQTVDWIRQPVFSSQTTLDDLFDGAAATTSVRRSTLGQITLSFSRQTLNDRKLNLLLGGGLIGALALLFGLALALFLSRSVSRPVARISHLVELIGRGEFGHVQSLRAQLEPTDPLYSLQERIHQMADQLQRAQDDLQQQVALATQQLRQKKEEAEAANLAKTRFLVAASHDLRQPTHALGLFVSRLAQLPHDAQTSQLIDHLQMSVLALQNLLDGLLDISRLEARSVQAKEGPFSVASLFGQLTQDVKDAAASKGLALRIHPTSAWALSDATLVYRILLNLVNNAVRYTQQGRVLVVARLRPSRRQVQVQVWDTGIGIAPEHQQAVFGEFYQVANAARDRTKGMGLGLSIVRRTADLLRLQVQLKSRLGVGTCVTLTLPWVEAPFATSSHGTADEVIGAELGGVNVLVIEDDALVRQALASVLQGWDMQVAQASGLKQARQHLARGLVPQVIISDYQLEEGANGVQSIKALRSDLQTDIPACLISGDTQPYLDQQARQAGLSLLQKPVRPAKLRSLLRRLVS